jgi:hypothetical protein
MSALMPRLIHLQPPAGFYRARADRFSPFQRDPASFGVTLDPLPAYRYLYPFDKEVVARIGYHFIMRSNELDQVESYTAEAEALSQSWRRHHADSALWVTQEQGAMVVHDERWGFEQQDVELHGAEAALLDLCWQATSWRAVREALGERFSDAALQNAADSLDARGFLMQEGVHLLALPLRQPGFRRAPAWPELRDGTIRPFADTGAMDLPTPHVRQPDTVA